MWSEYTEGYSAALVCSYAGLNHPNLGGQKLPTAKRLPLDQPTKNWQITRGTNKRYPMNIEGSLPLLSQPKQKYTQFDYFFLTKKTPNHTTGKVAGKVVVNDYRTTHGMLHYQHTTSC